MWTPFYGSLSWRLGQINDDILNQFPTVLGVSIGKTCTIFVHGEFLVTCFWRNISQFAKFRVYMRKIIHKNSFFIQYEVQNRIRCKYVCSIRDLAKNVLSPSKKVSYFCAIKKFRFEEFLTDVTSSIQQFRFRWLC